MNRTKENLPLIHPKHNHKSINSASKRDSEVALDVLNYLQDNKLNLGLGTEEFIYMIYLIRSNPYMPLILALNMAREEWSFK